MLTVVLLASIVIILPDLSRGARDHTGHQHATRPRPSFSLPSSRPMNPFSGRKRQNKARPSFGSGTKRPSLISDDRIDELTDIFKQNVERLKKNDKMDLIFLIDESTSVGLENFEDEIKFVSRFVSGIPVDINHTRVAVVTFADKVTSWVNQVSMGEIHAHKCSLLGRDLPAIEYIGGGTYTRGALERAKSIIENARADSEKILFVITDGFSTAGSPIPMAKKLKRQGIEIFTLGIREGNKEELTAIASDPIAEHCLILNDFKEFEAVARRALHSDLESGSFIVEDSFHCDKFCSGTNCCHALADCRCGTSTGTYECVCNAGYYGLGLKENSCYPCPEGTYKPEANPGDVKSCLPCPDSNMISGKASASLNDCTCIEGFNKVGGSCVPIRCEQFLEPMNGRFLVCDRRYLGSCTVTCDDGYDLEGTATLVCGGDSRWFKANGSSIEPTVCKVRYCQPLHPPENGVMSCNLDSNAYQTVCRFECNEGYLIHGSPSRVCEADRHWSGAEVKCTEIICPRIPLIDHGLLTGDCANSNKSRFGDDCSFSCPHEGYNLLVPPQVTCSLSGQWHPGPIVNGNLKICEDTAKPVIQCPDGFIVSTDIRKDTAAVVWPAPVASDNSEKITLTPLWTFPVTLRIGIHELTYTATDDSGLKSECSFTVTVEDREPPMIDSCRNPQPFVINPGEVETRHATWTDPAFFDNSGIVYMTSNVSSGPFALGKTNIMYTATDNAGNARSCVIEILVQNNRCPRLIPPRHGHIDCELYGDTTDCDIDCDSETYGFAMVKDSTPSYSCDAESKHWVPSPGLPLDCSKRKYSREMLKDYLALYKMETLTHCNDTSFLESVRQRFKEIFTELVPQWCANLQIKLFCTLVDVIVNCVEVETPTAESVDEGDGRDYPSYTEDYEDYYPEEEEAKRKKRTAKKKFSYDSRKKRSANEDNNDEYVNHGYTGPEAIPGDDTGDFYHNGENPFGDEMNAIIDNTLGDIILDRMFNHASSGEKAHKLEIIITIRGKVNLTGDFDTDQRRHSMMIEHINLMQVENVFDSKARIVEITNPNTFAINEISYDEDSFAKGSNELICPTGTVLKENAFCVNCPVGTYYEVISATCMSCLAGFYQDQEAQLSCQACPDGTSTISYHSRDLEDCRDLCPPGMKSDTGLELCKSCPKDTFTNFYGARECLSCPEGTGTLGRGSSSADDCGELCKPGSVSANGFVQCYPCLLHTYQHEAGKTYCINCPDGYQTASKGSMAYSDCRHPCENGATCRGQSSGYDCICVPGYTGENCQIEIDECADNPCAVSSTCVDLVNGYRCECAPGYEGKHCDIETNECEPIPCLNGGECIDLVDDFSCDCGPGYKGRLCDIDIDECSSNPCQHGGSCVDQVAGFYCICAVGFEGMMCEMNIDDCESNPCFHDAKCVDGIASVNCICVAGFLGEYCEEDVNECASSPCRNNGTCLDLVNKYICLCPLTFIGANCEEEGTPDFDLKFNSPNTYHHVKIPYGLKNLTEVTVAFYMWSNSSDTYGTPFSYAVGEGVEADAFTLTDLTALTLYVNGEFVVSDSRRINDGFWYHVTVVWTSKGGQWSIYLNGHLEDAGNGLATGKTISGGGVLVIGQEQDSLGGGFSASQEFIGTISQFNIYDYAFSSSQVLLLNKNCANNQGNVRAWPDFKGGIIGNVGIAPTQFCLPCPPMESDDGTSVVKTNDYTIVVTCNEGHSMVFRPKIRKKIFRCSNNGNWKLPRRDIDVSEMKCLKISCPKPEGITPGWVDFSSDENDLKFGDTAAYNCNTGFDVAGDRVRTCQANKKWSGDPPVCVDTNECLLEGTCHRDANCQNTEGSYACACKHGFKGNGITCKEINCGGAGSLQFGIIAGNNFTLGGVIRYSCEYGYRLEGPSERICLENVTWSGEMPKCVKVECAEPEDVVHSTKFPENSTRSYKSVVVYTCDEGHYMIGDGTRECGADSRWTGTLPSCKRVSCPQPPTIVNAVGLTQGGMKFGDVVKFVCENGYILIGDKTLRCNASKMWAAEEGMYPVCEHPTCKEPVPIIKGDFVIDQHGTHSVTGSQYTYGTKLRYQCSVGYDLVGTENFTCRADGTWDKDTIPRCEITSCGLPEPVENADYENSGIVFEDIVTYMCLPGYEMVGDQTLTCLANGKWTDPVSDPPIYKPQCLPKNCGRPEDLAFSQYHLTAEDDFVFKAVVTYTCSKGYNPKGNTVFSCGTEGEWIPANNFYCELVLCDEPEGIVYGRMTRLQDTEADAEYAYSHSVRHDCHPGFHMVGVAVLECTEHGNWSSSVPECVPVQCGTPPEVENSAQQLSDGPYAEGTAYKSVVKYTCDTGFYLTSGEVTKECLQDGSWGGSTPVCDPVPCGAVPAVEQARVSMLEADNESLFVYRDSVTFECLLGFYAQGSETVECTSDGVFSPMPHCLPVACESPPVVQYADMSQEGMYGENVFESKVRYACHADFRMNGDPVIKCSHNAAWLPEVPPVCEAMTCGDLVEVNNSFRFVSSSKDDVLYPEIYGEGKHQPRALAITACDEGYEIVENMGELRAVEESDSHLARNIQPDSVETLTAEKKTRIRKILGKLLDDSPAELNLAFDLDVQDVGSIPTTMFIQQCSQEVGWLRATPECTPMKCPSPKSLQNGHFLNDVPPETFVFGSEIKYKCDEGYEFFNSSQMSSDIVTVSCIWSDELWKVHLTSLPECIPLPCITPELVRNSHFTNPEGKTASFVFGNTISYSCDEGYEMSGSSVITCQSNQQWSSESPSCSPVHCPKPEELVNGKILGTRYRYKAVISFRCNNGYNLEGTSDLTCLANRAWSSLFPTCEPVPCGNPPEVAYSKVRSPSQVYGGCAIYSCKHGYYLTGYTQIKCTSSGEWETNLPSCTRVLCPHPALNNHGVYMDSLVAEEPTNDDSPQYVYKDVIEYGCEEGYETPGSESLAAKCEIGENIPSLPICQEERTAVHRVVSGYWSRDPPLCTAKDCGSPPKPHLNGIRTGDETIFQSVVHYSCKRGYYAVEINVTITCLSNGKWSRSESPDCLPVRCGKPPLLEHGSYTGTDFTFQSVVRYACDRGYEMFGSDDLTCQASGKWNDIAPSCQPVDCGRLPIKNNSKLSLESTILGAEAVYSCDAGYYLNGTSVFRCQHSGVWSHHVPPDCLPVDCEPPDIPDNGLVTDSGHVFKNTATYSCLPGYELIGEDTTECLDTAAWSGNLPTCQPVECGKPPLVEDAHFEQNITSTSYESTVEYACNAGYEMVEHNIITCQADRLWSPLPACSRVKCPVPDLPADGNISIGMKMTYAFEDVVTYSCHQGYMIEGQAETTCTSDRTWSSLPPTCGPVDCGSLPYVSHGHIDDWHTTFMSVVTYSCDSGYELVGDKFVECLHTGNWSSPPSSCEKLSCGKPPHLKHGSIVGADSASFWLFQSIIHYSCDQGYHLHGGELAECTEDGTWVFDENYYDDDLVVHNETQEPICELVTCKDPPEIENGQHPRKNYSYGNAVNYRCHEGFELVQHASRPMICTGDMSTAEGKYSSSPPTCDRVSCGPPPKIDNGTVASDGVLYESTAIYTCDRGFVLFGEMFSACLSNKRWSVRPLCEPKDCGPPALPDFSNLIVASTLFPTVVTLKCEDGYDLRGADQIECNALGLWSNEGVATCRPVDCGQPPNLPNGLFSVSGTVYRDRAVFSCFTGFTMEKDALNVISCQADGKWNVGNLACNPVECGLARTIENGRVIYHGTTYNSQILVYRDIVVYECDSGFNSVGEVELVCLDTRNFSSTPPHCSPVSCGAPPALKNGIVLPTGYTFLETALYTCNNGHVLSSIDEFYPYMEYRSVCNASALWDPAPSAEGCTRWNCGPPLIIPNAEVPAYTENTLFGDVYIYSCHEGYEAAENTLAVTCMVYGEWSARPDCRPVDCGLVKCPENAECESSGTILHSYHTATCDEGHEFAVNVRTYTRQCLPTAEWSDVILNGDPTLCILHSCGSPPTIENGRRFSADDSSLFGAQYTYSCDPGFDLDGTVTVFTCLGDKTWGPGPLPNCKPKDCGAPPSCVNDASCNFTSTLFKSTYVVSCNEGFELDRDVPRKELRCRENGEWDELDHDLIACKPMECVATPSLENGTLVKPRFKPKYKDTVEYMCNAGYNVQGSPTVTCQHDRSYSSLPTCAPVSCGSPPGIENGITAFIGDTYLNTASYSCNPGYYLEGSEEWICDQNGVWKVGKEIESPSPRSYVHVPEPRSLQTVLSEESGSGFEDVFSPISGRSVLPLSLPPSNLMMSQSPPTCQPVVCGYPPQVFESTQSETKQLVYAETVTYGCRSGFQLIGEKTLECQSDGAFGPHPPPACQRISCKLPVAKDNCKLIVDHQFVFESSIYYRPETGYKFSSSVTSSSIALTCGADGLSDVTDLPECIPISCGSPSVLGNGNYFTVGFTYGNNVTYACDRGHDLIGSSFSTCRATGKWRPRPPFCQPVLCGPPPDLDNGSYIVEQEYEPFTYNNVVKYTCDNGYKFSDGTGVVQIRDPYTITCRWDRSWDSVPPSCVPVPCPTLSRIGNGDYQASGDLVFGATALFKCAKGFELQGEPLLKCMSDGSWSSPSPFCSPVSCSSPPSVANSNRNGRNAPLTFGMQIIYDCEPGYELDGEKTLTCLAKGDFDFSPPVCRPITCEPPPRPANGYFLKDAGEFFFNTSVIYRCSPGYEMTSQDEKLKIAICRANRDWSSQPPTCIIKSCGEPETPTNGYVDGSSFTYRSMISFSCEQGYEISGKTMTDGHCLESHVCRICQQDGIWGTGNSSHPIDVPVCSPVSCDDPPEVEHASSTTSDYFYRGKTTYVCDRGYDFVATSNEVSPEAVNATCSHTAEWWPQALPACRKVPCPAPSPIKNGYHIIKSKQGSDDDFVYGDVISYECVHGYIISASVNISCEHTKLWDSEPPQCNPVSCGSPPSRKNGKVVLDKASKLTFNATLVYECDVGFEYLGDESDASVQCTADGIWSAIEISPCAPVDCGSPINIPHGSYSLSADSTVFRAEVTYTCNSGYEMNGNGNLSCGAEKKWEPASPTCSPVLCPIPPDILNGGPILPKGNARIKDLSALLKYEYGTNVQYGCDVGFVIKDQALIRCTENKTWSVPLPECVVVTCSPLPPGDNSIREGDEVNYGEAVTYTCKDGFVLENNTKSIECTCGPNGHFLPDFEKHPGDVCKDRVPECSRISCGSAVPLLNAEIPEKQDEYFFMDAVRYVCRDGFILKGNANISCRKDGSFENLKPFCMRISCGIPPAVDNSVVLIQNGSLKFEDVVSYECNPGYVLVGSRIHKCLSSGNWSDECITCAPVNCSDVRAPLNGYVLSSQGSSFGHSVVFACNEGFETVGSEVIICLATATWSSPEPACIPALCDPLPNVSNSVSFSQYMQPRFGDEIKYQCTDGYFLAGAPSISCKADGSWTTPPSCDPVTCRELVPVENGIIENYKIAGFTYGDLVSYACSPGYRLRGDGHTRLCQADGKFSSEEIFCTLVPCPEAPSVGNGKSSPSNAVYGTNVTYACDNGYRMLGSATMRCGIQGSWIDPPPQCKPVSCGSAQRVKFANVVDEQDEYFYKDIVSYACQPGYEFEDPDVTRRTCSANKNYSEQDVVCKPIQCPDLQKTANSIVKIESLDYLSEGSVSCMDGYVLSNGADEEKFTCLASKAWSIDVASLSCIPLNCSRIPSLKDGNVTFDHPSDSSANNAMNESDPDHAHSYGVVAKFACDRGFTLEGARTVTCDGRGTWSATFPACVPVLCGKPLAVENSLPIRSVFTFNMVVEYQCLEGYIFATEKTYVVCQADGTFSEDDVRCEKVSCPDLTPTGPGTLLAPGGVFGDENRYRCYEGYESDVSITCLSTGEWSGLLPPCKPVRCGFPPSVSNANLVSERTSLIYDQQARYECSRGFTLPDGNKIFQIHCSATGAYTEPESLCHIEVCDPGIDIEHGTLSFDASESQKVAFGGVASLLCEDGYQAIGDGELVCSDGGQWKPSNASCRPVVCGLAPKVEHAVPVLEQEFLYVYGSTVKYQCEIGYVLPDPENVISCRADGEFSDDAVTCEGVICDALPDIEHATKSSDSVSYGKRVVITCDDGYKIKEDQEIVVTCQADGKWSVDMKEVSCLPVECEPLEEPEFGTIVLDDALKKYPANLTLLYDSTIRYKCFPGYTLKGISTQRCRPDGSWSGSLPICKPVECGRPPLLSLGTTDGGKSSTFGSTVSYSCNEGYEITPKESSQRFCDERGSWTGVPPSCVPVFCGLHPSVVHATIEGDIYSYKSSVRIVCESGYKLTGGDEFRTCGADGTYSGQMPTCEKVICQGLPEIDDAVFSEASGPFFFNDSIFVVCEDGFELEGDEEILCGEDGIWINVPCCNEKMDDAPDELVVDDDYVEITSCDPPVINSTKLKMIDKSEFATYYNPGDKLEFRCVNGYVPSSGMTLECQTTGKWAGKPECVAYCKYKCKNRGRCTAGDRCSCSYGWVGSRCHKPICKLPCLNGGYCSGPFLCSCKPQWKGTRCQKPICEKSCQNGGRCVAPNACYCPYGYSGDDCSQLSFFNLWV